MPALDRSLGLLLRDCGRLFAKKFDQRVRRLGVTLAQCRVLGHLSRGEAMNQAELAELLDVEPITLARLIDRMEAAGLVERRADPADRRAYLLFTSAKAKPLMTEIFAIAIEVQNDALDGLSTAETDQMFALLNRVHANLSDRSLAAAEVEG